MPATVLIRGGGDLASGAAFRLSKAGLHVVITELAQPLMVRRSVSFGEAVYAGEIEIEGVVARRVRTVQDAQQSMTAGEIAVIIDPGAECRHDLAPLVFVDGRMMKRAPELLRDTAPLVLGMGPGFEAGHNCHAVIETKRGAFMGRVIWQGSADADTGIPEMVAQFQTERVLRAPCDGVLQSLVQIGAVVQEGQMIAQVAGVPVLAAFPGVLRGLIKSGLTVRKGMKIGDVDPRHDPRLTTYFSDKALAIGGGVLEAILTIPEVRNRLWVE